MINNSIKKVNIQITYNNGAIIYIITRGRVFYPLNRNLLIELKG
jgi:hypothetical protein